jgi:SNF2 family DNA or RNA helicase
MIEFSKEDFILKPYEYQYQGIKHLLGGNRAIFDEMGVGKTKQAIDAASILYKNGKIDTVIVVCPRSVRAQWDDEETGQIKKNCKSDYAVIRYDPANFKTNTLPETPDNLLWITISYSMLRSRLSNFLSLFSGGSRRILLILDESSYVKSFKAAQRKACRELRDYAQICWILNGTPTANHFIDLWGQLDIMDSSSINNIGYYHFRAKYQLFGGYKGKEILDFNPAEVQKKRAKLEKLRAIKPVSVEHSQMVREQIQNLEMQILQMENVGSAIENLKEKLKPWIIRREKKDVLKELPDKLPPVILEAQLTPGGYKAYKEMVDDMVAWADKATYSEAVNGAVKIGRLSQITSGFLGGLQVLPDTESNVVENIAVIQEVDDSKLSTFLEWYEENRHLKVVVWCRFRAEMFRLQRELTGRGISCGMIIGGQSDVERENAVTDFSKGKLDVLIANPASGGFGLDGLQNHCYTAVYMSMSHSLIQYLQSADRLHRNGQKMPVSYLFILAVTPKGGKTIDHVVYNAVQNKEEIAKWTIEKWRQVVRSL